MKKKTKRLKRKRKQSKKKTYKRQTTKKLTVLCHESIIRFILHHSVPETLDKLGNPHTWYNQSIFVNNNVHKYVELQTNIAELQPMEYLRPFVYLHVYSSRNCRRVNVRQQKSVCLLGGMGPLSDSHFISQLYATIKKSQIYDIHLFSIPPPRSLLHVQKLYYYVNQLRLMRMCIQHIPSIQDIFLISNTAHIYRPILSSLFVSTFNMIPAVQRRLHEKTIHSHTHTKFLILSTKEVSVRKLYSNVCTVKDTLELSSNQVKKIQLYIDQIKQNQYNYKIDPILTFIKGIVRKYNCYHIHTILACTELSIWYHKIRKKIPNSYVVTDVSSIMQDIILSHIQSNDYF